MDRSDGSRSYNGLIAGVGGSGGSGSGSYRDKGQSPFNDVKLSLRVITYGSVATARSVGFPAHCSTERPTQTAQHRLVRIEYFPFMSR